MSGLFQLSWLLMAKSPCVCLQPYRVVDTGKRLGGYRSVTVAPRGTEAVPTLPALAAAPPLPAVAAAPALPAVAASDGGADPPTDRGLGGASADRPGIGGDGEADHQRDDSEVGQPEEDPEDHGEVAQPQRSHCHSVAAFASALDLGASDVAEDDADETEEEDR